MATASSGRRGRPKDEGLRASRTDEILDCAAKIFAHSGYQNTEMQSIADALQIAKGTIYRYFPSKEELFLQAVMRGILRLNEEIQTSIADVSEPLERIAKAIYTYLAFFRNHPQYAELLIQERAQFKEHHQPTYFVQREKTIAPWRALYADLMAQGRVRKMPVESLMDVVSDLVYGTMFTNYFAGRHKPLEVQCRDLVQILFNGILSPAEQQRSADVMGNCLANHCASEHSVSESV